MNGIWLVQESVVTITVCDTELMANKIIEHYPNRGHFKKNNTLLQML